MSDLGRFITPLDAGVPGGHDGLGWDAEAQSVVVELLAVSDTEFDASVILDDAEEGPDAVRVFLTPESAQEFAARLHRVISAGRPPPALRRTAGPRRSSVRAHQRLPAGAWTGDEDYAGDDLDS